MNNDDLLAVQRTLRRRFFEGPQALRWRPGRELIAQLLLYLDDPQQCWRLTTLWLRETLNADRVDGGFGGFVSPNGRSVDYVIEAEALREDAQLPSVIGFKFDARDPGVVAAWDAPALLAIDCIQDSTILSNRLRMNLQHMGTAAKIAMPMRDGMSPVGIVCADWQREAPRWSHDVYLEVARLVRESLGPLMASTVRLGSGPSKDCDEGLVPSQVQHIVGSSAWGALTPAERTVALLISQGFTYKEVARSLGRSFSTVDHQLRSIRHKFGTTSTARLVHLLSENLGSKISSLSRNS